MRLYMPFNESLAELTDCGGGPLFAAFGVWVVAVFHTSEDFNRFIACFVCRPGTMMADRITSEPAIGSIMNHVAHPTRRPDPQGEAGDLIVPDDVVLLSRLEGGDYAL